MNVDVCVLDREADLLAAANLFREAMIGFPPLTGLAAGEITTLLEPGRTLGAFLGGELVGTADSTTNSLTVPGGARIGHGAVTHVGVAPTATRRGVATALLTHQLRDIRDRGEAVASLRASEATIYERFGYGVATTSQSVEVSTRRATFRAGVAHGGSVRVLTPDEVWSVPAQITSRHRSLRPGTIERTPLWWNGARRHGAPAGPSYVAVHGTRGAEDGFARYHPIGTDNWFVADDHAIVVTDLFAPTPEAYAGLIRFLLGLDLVDRVVFGSLPLDDPLPWLLTDRRAVRVTATRDETWLRVVDAHAALAARTFQGAGSVTVGVEDAVLPENSQVLRIGATEVERVTSTAQLVLGPAALGALLLGGTRWQTLARAGLVTIKDEAAIAVADDLFATAEVPYAGIYF
jgi:predicted acetyltransferase